MLEDMIKRIKREILNFKQLVQRSSATVKTITKTVQVQLTLPNTIDDATAVIYLTNNTDIPMLVEVSFDITAVNGLVGQGGSISYNNRFLDVANPLNQMVQIIANTLDSSYVGRTITLNVSITSTSDFTAEVL